METVETHTKACFMPLLTMQEKKLMGLDADAFESRMNDRLKRVVWLKNEDTSEQSLELPERPHEVYSRS